MSQWWHPEHDHVSRLSSEHEFPLATFRNCFYSVEISSEEELRFNIRNLPLSDHACFKLIRYKDNLCPTSEILPSRQMLLIFCNTSHFRRDIHLRRSEE